MRLKTLWGLADAVLAASALGRQAGRPRRPARRVPGRRSFWVGEPRNAVLVLLGTVLLVGGGRKLLQSWRARGAVGRLEDGAVTPEAIAAVADHGRAGLMELFRLLAEGRSDAQRDAAGRALSVLWARDELIAEEEKALVRRGFQVQWHARRRYPRALRAEIPVSVSFGVPFLRDDGDGVRPANLEWSYRVTGARRASVEVFSPWTPGAGRAGFALVPSDFETDGPHTLVLQARARTSGLTDSWELDLPHMPFRFEFDPRLTVDALLAQPDDARAEAVARAVRLIKGETGDSPSFLNLGDGLAVRGAPVVEVTTPLPCDLAHAIELEFEGVEGRFRAGEVVVSGQGTGQAAPSTRRVSLAPRAEIPPGKLDRPGVRRARARLVPDPDRGWSDPEVRSIWPGAVETGWIDVEVVRL